jgi:uroporphyrinogen decarboxylase
MPLETLTSRERVIRTLNRQPVDRYPIDLGSHMSTGISAFACWNLREALGLPTADIWMPDVVQVLAYVDEDLRQRFHLDCILLEPRWPNPARWNPRGKYTFTVPAGLKPTQNAQGEWSVRQAGGKMRMPSGGFFFDGDWLSNWSDLDEDDALDLYAREAERIYTQTAYATNFVGYSYGGGFGAFFGGIERCIKMLEEPDAVIAEHEEILQGYLRRLGKIIDKFGRHIQLITMADDMGTQDRPMCRPKLIEQFSAPYIRRFCDFIHRNSDIKVFLHNCGSIKPLIPLLIDCGIDVLNPVQISAGNMLPAQLKAEFGERMIFWGGGCDTQNVLASGTPAQVAENVRSLARTFKPGGGFVFNQVHNIMGDVPPENIIAMLDTAYAESFYPPR